MKQIICVLLMSLGGISSYAHDAKEAFFTLSQSDSSIVVEAEFPWTLRNALLTFRTELEHSKNQAEFDSAFFAYVDRFFVIRDEHQRELPLLRITARKSKGHAHQASYLFVFGAGELQEVSNRLMFNLSDQHTNHHSVSLNAQSESYATTVDHPDFRIGESAWRSWRWGLLLVLLLSVFAFLFRKKFLPH